MKFKPGDKVYFADPRYGSGWTMDDPITVDKVYWNFHGEEIFSMAGNAYMFSSCNFELVPPNYKTKTHEPSWGQWLKHILFA